MSRFEKVPAVAETPTLFVGLTPLVGVGLTGALATMRMVPGEQHTLPMWWVIPALGALGPFGNILLCLATGRLIRNQHASRSREISMQESHGQHL